MEDFQALVHLRTGRKRPRAQGAFFCLKGAETIGLHREDGSLSAFQELTDMSSKLVRSINDGSVGLTSMRCIVTPCS
jgi:hypothetical protein